MKPNEAYFLTMALAFYTFLYTFFKDKEQQMQQFACLFKKYVSKQLRDMHQMLRTVAMSGRGINATVVKSLHYV